MKSQHEDIRERLPGYVGQGLQDRELEAHLEECEECRREASVLRELLEMPLPEPGGMFFETLPQKVRSSVRKEKPGLFGAYVPVFSLILFVITAGYVYYMTTSEEPVQDLYTYSNPFAPQIYDFTDVTEDDIPPIFEGIESEEFFVSEDTPFFREFASLSSEELEALSEALFHY